MDLLNDISESWMMNHKVTQYLLEHLEPEWLSGKLGTKGRTIGEQFIHINNVRGMWIGKTAEKVNLKLDKKVATDKLALQQGLELTAVKMADALSSGFSKGKISGFKPHPTAFFAQIIAHESHHRGQIMATVTRNGFKIDKSVNFGLWTWHTK